MNPKPTLDRRPGEIKDDGERDGDTSLDLIRRSGSEKAAGVRPRGHARKPLPAPRR